MITLTQGQALGAGNLGILIHDSNGALMTPTAINFDIFSNNNGVFSPVLLSQTPANPSLGAYYANITIPTSWDGAYQLRWNLVQYLSSASDVVTEDFFVQAVDYASSSFEAASEIIAKKPPMDQKTADIVVLVRELLSDTNPDRNYHFRPPTPSKIVAGFTSRVGYIWIDTTIIRMLKIAISQLNTWNPMALYSYTLVTIPVDWAHCAAVGAASKCLMGEAARWAADEFGYSLNGVSLDINKAALYQGLGQSYLAEFEQWAPLITANRPASVGLRQQRWLLG
jgi:hypothetical protein